MLREGAPDILEENIKIPVRRWRITLTSYNPAPNALLSFTGALTVFCSVHIMHRLATPSYVSSYEYSLSPIPGLVYSCLGV